MESLNKIIVCLDHTKIDPCLVENASAICKLAEASEIIFIHIIKDFNLPDSVRKEFPNLLDKALEDRKKEIENLVETHFKCDIKTTILIKQGSETKEILKIANKLNADLIILGLKKTSNSVLSTRIARRSPCSLLLIPENVTLKLDSIFIPTDFSSYSSFSIEIMLALTKNLDSTIYLHNIYQVPSSYRYSGKTYKEFENILKNHAINDCKVLIKKATIQSQKLVPVVSLDEKGKIINIILETANEKKADLIVMGAKGRTITSSLLIGSKSERMIGINDSIPLLIARKKGVIAGILEELNYLK